MRLGLPLAGFLGWGATTSILLRASEGRRSGLHPPPPPLLGVSGSCLMQSCDAKAPLCGPLLSCRTMLWARRALSASANEHSTPQRGWLTIVTAVGRGPSNSRCLRTMVLSSVASNPALGKTVTAAAGEEGSRHSTTQVGCAQWSAWLGRQSGGAAGAATPEAGYRCIAARLAGWHQQASRPTTATHLCRRMHARQDCRRLWWAASSPSTGGALLV